MKAKFTRIVILLMLAMTAAMSMTCQKKESPPTGPDDGIPQDVVRIGGTVRDAGGNPLAGVALHVIYEFPQPLRLDPLDEPSSTGFYNDRQVLYTECGGTEPIPDGVMIKLFWDADSDGPDETDPQPPICDEPPECNLGPNQTVNFDEFAMNGVETGLGAGLFVNFPLLFSTFGDVLHPNRYYARIYCADGNVLYTSQTVNVPPGYSEQELQFTCTPCEGAPVIPAWSLDLPYPNPAWDTLVVRYGLRETAEVWITLRPFRGGTSDELLRARQGSGGHSLRVGLDDRPNGIYEINLSTSSFQQQRTLLKNESDYDRLRVTDAAVSTGGDGMFAFEAAAGITIDRTDSVGAPLGAVTLSRVTVAAIRLGYQIADTTLDVAGGRELSVDFVLREE